MCDISVLLEGTRIFDVSLSLYRHWIPALLWVKGMCQNILHRPAYSTYFCHLTWGINISHQPIHIFVSWWSLHTIFWHTNLNAKTVSGFIFEFNFCTYPIMSWDFASTQTLTLPQCPVSWYLGSYFHRTLRGRPRPWCVSTSHIHSYHGIFLASCSPKIENPVEWLHHSGWDS